MGCVSECLGLPAELRPRAIYCLLEELYQRYINLSTIICIIFLLFNSEIYYSEMLKQDLSSDKNENNSACKLSLAFIFQTEDVSDFKT